MVDVAAWVEGPSEIAERVQEQNDRLLETYRTDPKRVEQDANIERQIFEGGYSDRQVVELVQNAADALRRSPGTVEVVLTDKALYVANEGQPLSVKGVDSLMASHLSPKQVDEIGRFGLGFKSVLAISDGPELFSRSGSLGFNRTFAEGLVRRVVPDTPHWAITRVAQVLSARAAAEEDPELARLMGWATTVVRLPLVRHQDRLSDTIDRFPAGFVLFSPQIRRFSTRNLRSETHRQVELQAHEDSLVLTEGSKSSRWIVLHREHRPSPEALKDGGYHAAREKIDVQWALPLEGENLRVGQFWAYFPTDDLTTLSGIANAPWKLSEDRRTLLKGRFNQEVLEEVVPALVVEGLTRVPSAARPGAVVDLMPARGQEARSWADDVVNVPVMKRLAQVPSIPDLDGKLRLPRTMRLQPGQAPKTVLQDWADHCPDRAGWCHSEVAQSTERRAKVERLLSEHARTASDVAEWLEALVPQGTAEQSFHAVRIAAKVLGESPDLGAKIREARIVLLEDGSLVRPHRERVFVRAGAGGRADVAYIHPDLVSVPGASEVLGVLGITVLDPAGQLRHELSQDQPRWALVWETSRELEVEDAAAVFEDRFPGHVLTACRVRAYDGRWIPMGGALLEGEVIPGDGRRDGSFLVDPRYHARDEQLLRALGAVDAPGERAEALGEPWLAPYRKKAREDWRREMGEPGVKDDSLDFRDTPVPVPLQLLSQLSDEGRLCLTTSVTRRFSAKPWKVFQRSRPSRSLSLINPMWVRLRDEGRLQTPLGPQPPRFCIRPWEEFQGEPLPVAWEASDRELDNLRVVSELSDLPPEAWTHLLQQAESWADDDRRTRLYAWAAESEVPAPPLLRVRAGRGPAKARPRETAVTADAEVLESLILAGIPALLARAEDVPAFTDAWHLARGEDMLQEEIVTLASGESVLLLDRFPALEAELDVEDQELALQGCSTIEILTSTPIGQKSRPLAYRREDDVLYVTGTSDGEVLSQCIRALGLTVTPQEVHRRTREMHERKRRNEVRRAGGDEERLLLAVGEDAMRRKLPDTALEALRAQLDRDLTPVEVARLAIAVHGYGVLREHRDALHEAGLTPPKQWAGLRPAREWAQDLGFPIDWAGFSSDAPPAEFRVDGPADIPPLHDYQQQVAARIQMLLHPEAERNRGLVSLPTGAGKTRVAVEALINHARTKLTPARVVWIAQSDELCEQAVQTWTYLWRALGPSEMALAVGRLWGSNDISEVVDAFHVVVATPEKVNVLDLKSYAWLPRPSIIVIDEAHTSINQEGNELLRRLGDVKQVPQLTTSLLGLTATPFRGENEEETRRLVDRYHGNRLDPSAFNGTRPMEYLQEHGVLARVDQRLLEGADVQPTEDELRELRSLRRMPRTIESRLAANSDRNRTIVDSILGLPEDASVLVFATSVQNARALAAMLAFQGVAARSVESGTDTASRRRYVADFREGRLRVLTNYGVFAQGFDVPGVDAVYVTRPTYSPNLYQQMIGRGLRGPLNGGKEEVVIVNVADNIEHYGEELAFHHFDYLWGAR